MPRKGTTYKKNPLCRTQKALKLGIKRNTLVFREDEEQRKKHAKSMQRWYMRNREQRAEYMRKWRSNK